MDALSAIGTFLGGLGLLLMSFAMFWFCSLYKEYAQADTHREE
ncbi:hypothetical protein [Pseudoteredinibacter isoporae]